MKAATLVKSRFSKPQDTSSPPPSLQLLPTRPTYVGNQNRKAYIFPLLLLYILFYVCASGVFGITCASVL